MKYEWRKNDKNLYLPKNEPELINVPAFNYFIVDGKGDPNTSKDFSDAIEALYSLSYGIKMMPKKGEVPKGYYEYSVFPLEGVWDMEVDENTNFKKLDKSKFIFSLMIRQPDFVNKELANKVIELTRKKKTNVALEKVRFESIDEGLCVQMMHFGSYGDEPASFDKMNDYCTKNGYKRIGHIHREIYLSDFRRTETSKLKTILRMKVEKI